MRVHDELGCSRAAVVGALLLHSSEADAAWADAQQAAHPSGAVCLHAMQSLAHITAPCMVWPSCMQDSQAGMGMTVADKAEAATRGDAASRAGHGGACR